MAERVVSSQEELVRLLRKAGINATQASISRDVRELGFVRVQGRYVSAEGFDRAAGRAGEPAFESELVISVEPVGANLIVVKTPPGGASAVAYDLDGRDHAEIAGTVAGDDTIFVAVRSRSAQGRVLALLRRKGNP